MSLRVLNFKFCFFREKQFKTCAGNYDISKVQVAGRETATEQWQPLKA